MVAKGAYNLIGAGVQLHLFDHLQKDWQLVIGGNLPVRVITSRRPLLVIGLSDELYLSFWLRPLFKLVVGLSPLLNPVATLNYCVT